jgi:hypothetical protein
VSSFDANAVLTRKCEVVSTLVRAAPLTAPVFMAVGSRLADTRSAVNSNHASSVAQRQRHYLSAASQRQVEQLDFSVRREGVRSRHVQIQTRDLVC